MFSTMSFSFFIFFFSIFHFEPSLNHTILFFSTRFILPAMTVAYQVIPIFTINLYSWNFSRASTRRWE